MRSNQYSYDDARFPGICCILREELANILETRLLPAIEDDDRTAILAALEKAKSIVCGLTICASAKFDGERPAGQPESGFFASITGDYMLAELMLSMGMETRKIRLCESEGAVRFGRLVERVKPSSREPGSENNFC